MNETQLIAVKLGKRKLTSFFSEYFEININGGVAKSSMKIHVKLLSLKVQTT